MAIVNDPRMFSGGAVAFDTQPTVDMYAKIQSQNRAKQEAIDEYMRSLQGKITPTGVRKDDLPAFEVMRKKLFDYGVKNRDRILKDPLARSEFDTMAQDLFTFVQESKQTEEKKKPFVELLTDPTKRAKMRDEVFGMVAKHDEPLYTTDEKGNLVRNYGRKDIDFTSRLFKDPEFDFQKTISEVGKDIKPGEIVDLDKPQVNKQTGLVWFPAKEKFSESQIAQFGQNMKRAVLDDEDKMDYYENRLATIPLKEYQEFDKVYNKVFGGRIEKNPERLAMAEAALHASNFVGKETMKPKSDYQQKLEDKRINISLNQGGGSGGGQMVVRGNEFDRIPVPKKSWGRKEGEVYANEIPEATKAILKSAGINIADYDYFVPEVKDGVLQSITPYWKDKEGNLHKEGVITRKDMENAQLKYNAEPQKGQQPQFGNQNERLPKEIDKTRMKKRNYKGLDKNGNPIFE